MQNTNDKPKLYLMIGNIGSGKSTLCKYYKKKGAIVLSRDALRYALGSGDYLFDYKYEPIIQKTIMVFFTSLLKLKSDIVIDEVNAKRKNRIKYIKLAKEKDYEVIALVMPYLNKEDSIERRLSNNHGNISKEVWNEVWEKFNVQYDIPILPEGFDKIILI